MNIIEKINNDWKEALRNKQTLRKETLSTLRAVIKNSEIERRGLPLEDNTVVNLIQREVKKRYEARDAFLKGNRNDSAEKEEAEAHILNEYIPSKMSNEEMNKIVDKVINELHATGIADMGKVMKQSIIALSGKADNKDVSLYIREKLS